MAHVNHVNATPLTLDHPRRTPRHQLGIPKPQLSLRLKATETPLEVSRRAPSLGTHAADKNLSDQTPDKKVSGHPPGDTPSRGHLSQRRMKYNLTLL